MPKPPASRTSRSRTARSGHASQVNTLRSQGLSESLAEAVARGRLSPGEALRQMAVQEEAGFLMRRHGLDRALAIQVAMGHADLKEVLASRRFEAYRATHAGRSVFDEAVQDGAPRWFGLVDGSGVEAVVRRVDRYDVEVVAGSQRALWAKREVTLVGRVVDASQIRRELRRDRQVPREAPAAHPKDRYPLGDRRLFRYVESEHEVRLALVSGHAVRGVVVGFARFELSLRVRGGAVVRVLRHAVSHLGRVRS